MDPFPAKLKSRRDVSSAAELLRLSPTLAGLTVHLMLRRVLGWPVSLLYQHEDFTGYCTTLFGKHSEGVLPAIRSMGMDTVSQKASKSRNLGPQATRVRRFPLKHCLVTWIHFHEQTKPLCR